jgi:hypothetical protein
MQLPLVISREYLTLLRRFIFIFAHFAYQSFSDEEIHKGISAIDPQKVQFQARS